MQSWSPNPGDLMPTLTVAKDREHFWATVCVGPMLFALSPPLILTELCGGLANVLNLPKRKPRPREARKQPSASPCQVAGLGRSPAPDVHTGSTQAAHPGCPLSRAQRWRCSAAGSTARLSPPPAVPARPSALCSFLRLRGQIPSTGWLETAPLCSLTVLRPEV